MTTTLLPKARIGVKKTTISASVLRELKPEKGTEIEKGSKKESYLAKLEAVRDFFLTKFKTDKITFREKLKRRQDEKRRVREEAIEKKKKEKKESKSKTAKYGIKTPATLKDIFSSIGNFLLFLAGGVIFNAFGGLEKSLKAIEKSLDFIGGTVQIFANVVEAITNFIDASYKGYDEIKKQISNITGLSEEQVADFAGKLNKLINGVLIASLIVLRGLPAFLKAKGKTPSTPTTTTTSSLNRNRVRAGSTNVQYNTRAGSSFELQQLRKTRTKFYSATGLRNVSNASMGRFNDSMARYITGKANSGDMLRLLRRGFFKPFAKFALNSKALKILPFGIGSFIDFLIQYFVFKEPIGRAAFKSIGAGLFGFIGGLLGGPFAVFTGLGGALIGDVAGGMLYDAIFGAKFNSQVVYGGLDEQASYDQITETTITAIQPIVT